MQMIALVLFLIFSGEALAEDCKEHAILHDLDHFKSEYRWSQGRVEIKVWESPATITVVGKVMPNAQVQILEKSEDYYRIKVTDEQGGAIGWIHKAQIDTIIKRDPENQTICY
ncbi:MAG: SH3 domain-containing protein [Deltaproteobacteria bacterium]|nr:SH3 domain-containing protein [Deltaproteobacteria bacterium]